MRRDLVLRQMTSMAAGALRAPAAAAEVAKLNVSMPTLTADDWNNIAWNLPAGQALRSQPSQQGRSCQVLAMASLVGGGRDLPHLRRSWIFRLNGSWRSLKLHGLREIGPPGTSPRYRSV